MDKYKEPKNDDIPEEEIDWDVFFAEDEEWEQEKKRNKKRRNLIVKVIGSLLVFSMIVTFALQVWFNLFNIPALNFLEVSNRLSKDPVVKEFKQAVVTVEWDGVKGTGFNIDPNGLIVTNEHVVEDAKNVQIHFKSHGTYIGKVISTNQELDLAIVKLDSTESLPTLPVSDEENWEKWADEKITFIGNPLAFTQIANEGKIMETMFLNDEQVPAFLIDAPIYKGNSGSPLINEMGEVIGIVYATIYSDPYNKTMGLATPSYFLREVLPENKKGKSD